MMPTGYRKFVEMVADDFNIDELEDLKMELQGMGVM